MDETKRITTAFQDKAAGAGSIEALQCDLDNIEKAFTDCNEELAAMEMPDCGYCFQGEAILEMTENLRALFIYVGCAHPHVSEVLDFPLYTDFKSNATESLSHIVLDDIRTDNTFGMEEHVEVNDAGYLRVDSRVKEDLGFSDFFGITDIRPQDGYPVLENVETVGEFASLFRADYDRMKPEGMDINTFLEGYLTYGEYEHTGYHPVRDFLSGLADVTIIIPVIDAILGKDIITGETLNDFERGMKAAGAAIDLFTLGQAMVLAGGVEAGAGIIVKTLAVEMVSNAAGYSAGYAANEMGMPLPVTWILSVATGCTVSATVGGYLFTSADGTITKCTPEEAGDLIKRLDKTDSPTSFADMMSPEDATRYLRFLENGSTEGLTSAELEGIKKVDELLALKKISYQDVLDIRNSGKALEGGTDVLDEIKRIDEIEVEFNYNSKYDETEFARQLAAQQKGMNELTVQEYLDNRHNYIEQGRAIESNAAQQAAREKAFIDKVDELQDAGLSLKEAEEQAQKWLDTQAALHNPDQVAGGHASNIGGVGDKGVNSSIGSQWRYRIDEVDAKIQKMAESMSEAERNSTYLNVNLTYKGD